MYIYTCASLNKCTASELRVPMNIQILKKGSKVYLTYFN